jgi:flagellar basal-body rod protein FlgB
MPGQLEKILFAKTGIPRLGNALDLSAARQKLLTQNVANAETVGYKRKDINFQAELQVAMGSGGHVAMKTTRPGHMGATEQTRTPKVNEENIPAGQKFGVDIDREMVNVAQNQLEYNVAAKLVRQKFDALKTAIRGRT